MQFINNFTQPNPWLQYLMKKIPSISCFWLFLVMNFGLTSCVSRLDPKHQMNNLSTKYQQMLLNDNSSEREWHILIQQWQKIAESQSSKLSQESLWATAMCWIAMSQQNNNRAAITKATQLLQEYTRTYPDSPNRTEAECLLGYYARQYNQLTAAIQHYQTVLQIFPDHRLIPFVKKDLIDIYIQQKNMTDAFQLYESLKESEILFLAEESRKKLSAPRVDLPLIQVESTKMNSAHQLDLTTKESNQSQKLKTSESKEKVALESADVVIEPESSIIKVPYLPDLQEKPSLVEQLGLRVKTVVIDVGHGGRDPGAVGLFNSEKSIVLKVARMLKSHLEVLGYQTHLTRESDQTISLKERTELANRVSADLFISLHANASNKEEAMGIETYYLALGSDETSKMVALRENEGMEQNIQELESLISTILKGSKTQESQQLAEMVQQQLIKKTMAKNRGVKHAPFVVLTGTKVPAILVEIGFVSNSVEAIKLSETSYQNQIAEAIAVGIHQYAKRVLSSKN